MGLKLYMQLSYKTSDWLYNNEKQFNTMQFNYEEGKGCVVLYWSYGEARRLQMIDKIRLHKP